MLMAKRNPEKYAWDRTLGWTCGYPIGIVGHLLGSIFLLLLPFFLTRSKRVATLEGSKMLFFASNVAAIGWPHSCTRLKKCTINWTNRLVIVFNFFYFSLSS